MEGLRLEVGRKDDFFLKGVGSLTVKGTDTFTLRSQLLLMVLLKTLGREKKYLRCRVRRNLKISTLRLKGSTVLVGEKVSPLLRTVFSWSVRL